jgi:DNA-binding beta-propeller fold protein YncE
MMEFSVDHFSKKALLFLVPVLLFALSACGGGGGTSNPTYTVTYDGNGNTGGTVPVDPTHYTQGQTVTVLGNTGNLVKTLYAFTGWNTQPDGSGTTYAGGDHFRIGSANVTLYAKWANKFAYVANNGDGTVSQYTIDANGTLTAMNPATVNAGVNPRSVAVDPSGKYVYVANNGDGTVSQYTIGANGTLTAMNPATVNAGTGPISVAVDPSGKYVYVANNGDGTVSQYTIGANGTLTAMSPATVAAGVSPASVSTTGASQ